MILKLMEAVKDNCKDDQRFVIVGTQGRPNRYYYYDDCLKLNKPFYYKKGEFAIKGLIYTSSEILMITRPDLEFKNVSDKLTTEEIEQLYQQVLEQIKG